MSKAKIIERKIEENILNEKDILMELPNHPYSIYK